MQFSYNPTYPPEMPHAALPWVIVQIPRIGIPRKFRQRTPWTYPRLEVTTQGALRAVLPLTPLAPYSPSQSPGGEGEPSGLGGCATSHAKAMGAEVNDSPKAKFRLTRSQRRGT
jgi:hypothetical protein